MTHSLRTRGTPTVVLVRRGLVALTVIGILATAFELAAARHWNEWEQLIPWAALLALASAAALSALPGGRGTTAARVLALLVLGASAYGVLEHLLVNVGSGPHDQRYADAWQSFSLFERGWYAITKTVGPAPPLAPGVLGQTALLLLLATICHPHRPDNRQDDPGARSAG
ncbi:hypothetical protein [Pseudonocardia adelaidensis]|uniref:Uncharacterized protein n=1 Tax=Pseudonocardia adelaidensis TaxID=648754 RepID=A0ABP9NGZ3_9PSEU